MLRHPVAVVDPTVSLDRQLDGMLEGLGGGVVLVDRTLVQDAKRQPVSVHVYPWVFAARLVLNAGTNRPVQQYYPVSGLRWETSLGRERISGFLRRESS